MMVIMAMLLAISLTAQTSERKWGLGLTLGSEHYSGELGNGFFSFSQGQAFSGITFARNITEHFDVVLNTSVGDISYSDNSTSSFTLNMLQININAKYNFYTYDDVKFRPFVFAGLGYLHFSHQYPSRKLGALQLPDIGAGLTYKLSQDANIVFQETFIHSNKDDIDYSIGNGNDLYMQHSVGIVFNFGKAKDRDGDGVSDAKDDCPDLVGPVALGGCPDTDGDGVADKYDTCPDEYGVKELAGCPDADGDGIADIYDTCPEEPGLEILNGCPDTDGDGIANRDDACPEEPGLEIFNGCPDTDGDGIADINDTCPEEPGLELFNGCPDTDGDGIADFDDACPDTAGIAENKGCPKIEEEITKVLEQALHGIKFVYGKDVITNSSYEILNNLVDILTKNPMYRLLINGHTDSSGREAGNLRLSQRRAELVKKYLIDSGVEEDRLTATGYGETMPIENNATSQGRAKNRRVELIIEF